MLISGLQPTSKNSQAVLADFKNISSSTTYGEIVNFLDVDFTGEGQELKVVALPSDYNASPPFLINITSPITKAFVKAVHGFWPRLIRATNVSAICGSGGKCESTLMPLKHSFVIPGSCFDYQYTLTKTILTMNIRWKIQRTTLLGQFLDFRRPYSIPVVLDHERNSSKLYGSNGYIWLYPKWRPYLLCALSITIPILLFN